MSYAADSSNLRSRAAIAMMVICLAAWLGNSQHVADVTNDYVVLSSGTQEGIREGMTGRIVSTDNVGGASVQIFLAVFRVVRVDVEKSTAVLMKGSIDNLKIGMEVDFDPAPTIPSSATSPGTSQYQNSGYVLIHSGAFVMGCDRAGPECDQDERPAHSVVISKAFEMSVAEITNGQYRECVDIGRCATPRESAHLFENRNYDRVPVLGVTWEQADSYCRYVGGRLPTEAEWEFAALGGARKPVVFPWGDEPPSCWSTGRNGARFDDDKTCDDAGPAAVASFEPNGHGLFDMAGNAWEWTSDFYSSDFYSNSARRDPKGPSNGYSRVVRGGGWSSSSRALRITNRLAVSDGQTSANIGFRCVKDVDR